MADDDPELPDRDVSPYPLARAARVPAPAKGKLGAVLVARPMGCLVVRITFHKDPCAGLTVKFAERGDDGTAGAAIGDETKSDARGVAGLEFMVPAGLYVCQIQGQAPTVVSTVPDPAKPHPVITPIDRPYYDVGEAHEWHDEDVDGALPETTDDANDEANDAAS